MISSCLDFKKHLSRLFISFLIQNWIQTQTDKSIDRKFAPSRRSSDFSLVICVHVWTACKQTLSSLSSSPYSFLLSIRVKIIKWRIPCNLTLPTTTVLLYINKEWNGEAKRGPNNNRTQKLRREKSQDAFPEKMERKSGMASRDFREVRRLKGICEEANKEGIIHRIKGLPHSLRFLDALIVLELG